MSKFGQHFSKKINGSDNTVQQHNRFNGSNNTVQQQSPLYVLDVSFSSLNMAETVDYLTSLIQSGNKAHVVTANPEIVMAARKDGELLGILSRAGLITPDGIGIILAAKLYGYPIQERVAGYDLLHQLMARANTASGEIVSRKMETGENESDETRSSWRVYLLGASPDSLAGTINRLRDMYPLVDIAGWHDGYFQEDEEMAIAEEINRIKPHILFVALGAPRQEYWIGKHFSSLDANVVMGVGGSFDVLSGKVKRAPLLWQKLNLEWLYRLLSQPSRWRRQLALPYFAVTVLFNRLFKRVDRGI